MPHERGEASDVLVADVEAVRPELVHRGVHVSPTWFLRELRIRGLGQTGPKFREACIRCPVLRPDPEQMPRLEEIHANLLDRLQEAKEQRWLGEVAAIEASLAAAEQKLAAMRD
ncbi:hypothetical protein ACIO6T_44900 [Streptomyces sp. NPDC087532]|uniref:hypothetical protein n=1 Tax=unclassified Streptomyces TaxID=2593676 RepID=UPI003331C446